MTERERIEVIATPMAARAVLVDYDRRSRAPRMIEREWASLLMFDVADFYTLSHVRPLTQDLRS